MVFEVLEPNFLKFKQKLISGGVRTIDEVMTAHQDFLDECLNGCLLMDQNMFRIFTRIFQNNNFFCRIMQRFFNQLSTNETHEQALQENDRYYGGTKKYYDEEEEKGAGVATDMLAARRRQERNAKKA